LTCYCGDGVCGVVTGLSYLNLVFALDSGHLPDHAEEENLRDDWDRNVHPSLSNHIKTSIKIVALVIPDCDVIKHSLVR
jgi:hypothetical protein